MTASIERVRPAAPLRADAERGHPLIDQVEAITPAWLTAVLRAAAVVRDAAVVGVVATPVGNGLVATTVRLTLEYDRPVAGAPATLVAKLTSVHEASRMAGVALAIYRKEVRFYQHIAPQVPFAVARALFADIDAAGERFCLLMEDLFPARTGDQIAGCTLDDAEAAMATAAGLHAPFWGSAQLDALDWIDRARDTSLYVQGYRAGLEPVLARYAPSLTPAAVQVATRFGDRIEDYYARQPRPWTITHQDFRLDNLLFDAKGGQMPVAALDWQTVRIGPGMSDVAYFIGAGLDAPVRRLHERALIALYRDRLQQLGVSALTPENAWTQYRLLAADGLITAIAAAAMVTPSERGDRVFTLMIARHAQHMLDLDTLSLLD